MDDETAGDLWIRQHAASCLRLVTTLQSEGWETEVTCEAAPVQVEGRLPSGEQFSDLRSDTRGG